MGAEQFVTYAEGEGLDDAFRAARDQALYDHGHAGYSGTIAEKPGAVRCPREHPRFDATREGLGAAESWAWDDLDRYDNDKWGEAWAIPLYREGTENVKGWLFYGWASS